MQTSPTAVASSGQLSGALLATLGMTILGGSVSLSRLILDYPTFAGQAIRYALAAAILAAAVRWLPRLAPKPVTGRPLPDRREFGLLVAVAAIGLVAFNLCVLTALRHADAAIVGTVIGATPLALALAGPLLRGARPAARLTTAAAISVIGIALVHGGGEADAIGLLAAGGALVGEVSFSLLAAAVLPRLGAVRVSAWSCALAVPMLLLFVAPAGELARLRPPTALELTGLLYLALALTVVAFLAWFTALRRLGVERTGLFAGLLPVATLASAAIMDGELPDPVQTAGVLLVVVCLLLGLRSDPPKLAITVLNPVPAGSASTSR